ncbi:unnamed protein product, partial [Ectocarpus fasciculatus]
MFTTQPVSPLPPLNSDDSPPQHQRGSFNSFATFGGASPVPANRLFEAKAVNLVPRPKTSTSYTRQLSSSSSLGLFPASSSPSPSSPNGDQPAPRHDKDMARPRAFSASEQHHQQQPKHVNSASAHGDELDRSSGSNNNKQLPSATAPTAEAVPRWSSSLEGHASSASAPATVGLVSPETARLTSPQQHHNATNTHHSNNSNRSRRNDSGRGGNTAGAFSIPRSDSLGNAQSQPRAQTTSALRRSSSATSETFSNGGRGFNGGNGTSSAGASVASSNDPNVLKVEINRLQAALMNGFKGGDRFVGGAQFKASSSSRNGQRGGGGGGVGGKSCGGCLQVREALRRSRVECRDLRGSLFRAEHVIKQLTLTKAARRRGANQSGSYTAHQQSSSSSLFAGGATTAAITAASEEQERRLVPQMLTTSGCCGGERGGTCSSSRNDGHAGEAPSRENLLSRVQELERELRLADFRDARSMGAAVGAEHIRARKNVMDDEVHLNKSDSDHDANVSSLKKSSSASLRGALGKTSGAGSSRISSSVWDWEGLPPCSKCSALNDRLLGE